MLICTAQKMKFSIKDFFSKCDQIHSFLRIWSHLLKKSLMENFIFYAVILKSIETLLCFILGEPVMRIWERSLKPIIFILTNLKIKNHI